MLTNTLFNILGIDPGNNLGISCFIIDATTYKIINIDTRLVILSNLLQDYNHRIDKMVMLNKVITDMYSLYQPLAVGVESAFMNTKFATAVIQLSQYVGMIEYSLYTINPYIKILKYPPKYIKSKVATGDANKDDMLTAISKIKEITKVLNIKTLSEHQVDATAIGYTLLEDIRQYPLLLHSIM